ncbi:cbb3-type cytochrome oxidase assembly protein CcoS [Gilvimarinus sp. DA14]|uniref:cbb3-type cytochrome oxidase assembly protein CcoS n=1 Tax=Gilvimarinus sp. DA14 TaxID=2956798 RepID=UPI0020B71B69|nr:cbb3-type cytochrome oxidase assembly protein CcoS [Gilvimarinus sp. DA14]UTF60050.1 cbb3-type cytochrome oxidase assembly protein CcoS [Gilvimarinus sp. DA14]
MDSLFFLIPVALVFVAIAVRVLFWAINSGQYDNLDTEAHRILFDDERDYKKVPPSPNSENEPQQNDEQNRG